MRRRERLLRAQHAVKPDGCTQRLGDAHERRHSVRGCWIIAAHDDGRARGCQYLGYLSECGAIGLGTVVKRASRRRGDTRLLLHDIDRQAHEHRPARSLIGNLEGAAQNRPHFVGTLDLHTPFRHRSGHGHEIVAQYGICQPHARVLLARRHHHRRARAQGAEQHARRISQTRRDVETDDTCLARRLRVKTGRTQSHALMQRRDVADGRVRRETVEQRTFRRARIAENPLDAVRLEAAHENITSAHVHHPTL